jgi:enamine deaminase RidA (YjgF/YER057c/UK114 family)
VRWRFNFYVDRMTIKLLPLVAGALMVSVTASAQAIKEIPLPASQNPSGADLPIAGAVWAGNTLYISGWLDPERKTDADTKSQTVGILADIQKLLVSQGLTMANVVSMHVYLGNNPATDGKPDFAGLMGGYTQFFGTKDQPHKPSRTVVQVTLPAAGSGALIEIDIIAVRAN